MSTPPASARSHESDATRAAVLRLLGVLDVPADPALSTITALAARLCGFRYATINLLSDSQQVSIACFGGDVPTVPLEESMCQVAVRTGCTVVTSDAAHDPKFAANPFVDGRLGAVRSYIGVPMRVSSGVVIGTLCLYDEVRRTISPDQLGVLDMLADHLAELIETRTAGRDAADLVLVAQQAEERLRSVLEYASVALATFGDGGIITSWNAAAHRLTGLPADAAVGRTAADLGVLGEGGAAFDVAVRDALRTGTSRMLDKPFQVTIRTPGGDERLVEVSGWITDHPDDGRGLHLLGKDVTEQADAEHRLRTAEDLARMAFDQAATGMSMIAAVEGEPRYVRVNPAFAALLGRTTCEVLAAAPGDLVHPDDRDADRDLAPKVIAGELGAYQREKRYLRADGATVWTSFSASLGIAADGSRYLLCQILDITELKAAAGVLATQSELLDLAREAIIVRDPDGTISYWNRGAEQLYGYSAAQAVGRVSHELLATRFPGQLPEIEQRASGTGGWTGDLRHTTADGRELVVSSGWTTRTGPDGGTFVLEINTDVTRARRDEAVRREVEALFQAAFEHSPIGIGLVGLTGDTAGELIRANDALCRLLRRDDLVGNHLALMPEEDEVPAMLDMVQGLGLGLVDKDHLVCQFGLPTGTSMWCRVDASLVRDGSGGPTLAVLHVTDVSEQHAREEWLTRQAMRDPLTGLANRLAIYAELDHRLAAVPAGGDQVAVYFCDLNGFKAVNDELGHQAGDALLCAVGRALASAAPAGSLVGRIGGDEFVVISTDVPGLAERLRSAVGVLSPGEDRTASISVGGAVSGTRPISRTELLQRADREMYRAKQARAAGPLPAPRDRPTGPDPVRQA